jgi:hypothetical protein
VPDRRNRAHEIGCSVIYDEIVGQIRLTRSTLKPSTGSSPKGRADDPRDRMPLQRRIDDRLRMRDEIVGETLVPIVSDHRAMIP